MENKKVSVIVPVYNVEKYIDTSLTSICGQTYPDLEILLIDDGSTDASMEKCREWAKKDENLMNDPLFEECLLAIIACQLTRTKIEMIHSPSEYKVGDTTLKYSNTSLGLYGNIQSWCDYYRSLLSSLTNKSSQ